VPRKRPAEGAAVLDKALDLLDAVGRAGAGLSQAELAARLDLPRTTMYRLLGVLVARGLLRRDPLRRVYGLGMRCFEYARAAVAMPDLVAAASAELRALRDMTGETSYLAALDGREAVSLERCDGAHSQRSASVVGQRKPLHCTSQGKAMLAALPADARDALVREISLSPVTPRSITDRRRLYAELRLSAQRGYTIDDEEIVPGVRCCGAAIVDAAGQVRGALSVAGPSYRFTLERLHLLGPEVAAAARRVGAALPVAASAPVLDAAVRAVPGDWAFAGAFPRWLPAAGRLVWADRLAPALHAVGGREGEAAAAGSPATVDRLIATLEEPIAAIVPFAGGVLVQDTAGAAHAFDAEGRARAAPAADLPVLPSTASALAVAPDGALWAAVPEGGGWRVGEVGPHGVIGGGWRLGEAATAIAWDAEGHHLVIAAAGSGTLFVGERIGGAAGPLRRLATVPRGSGRLGGLAVDERGGFWSALRGGWSVVRFEPDGSVDRIVALPVPDPTDLAFGGPARDRLYVTTAREAATHEALDAAPLSGRLFVIEGVPAGVVGAGWRG
jgi:DNA-binding IclR family transcriptional regulator/sugar lactone lactonase YvrE